MSARPAPFAQPASLPSPLVLPIANGVLDSTAWSAVQGGTAETVAPSDPVGGPGGPGTEGPDGGAPPSGGSSFLVPMLLVGAIFWFVMIGPERKQRKKRASMLSELGKGAKVMTTSGMIATVVQVQDDEVTLQAAEGVRLRFSLSAIQTVLADNEKAAEAKS